MTTPYYKARGCVIYHGDCRDVLPTLDAVDHVITDPPYSRDVYTRLRGKSNGLARQAAEPRHGKTGIRNHQYSSISIEKLGAGEIGAIDEILDQVAIDLARLVRRWGLVFSDVETCHVWREQLSGAGLRYVRTGAWVKPDSMPQFSGDRPSVGFEPCTIAHALGPMRWSGGGHAAVWTYNTVKGDERPDHPCPKPIALMRKLVEAFTDPGDLIIDPFMGSGTTLLAAYQLGRRAIGIELEEKWAEVAAKRLEDATPPLTLEYAPEPYATPRLPYDDVQREPGTVRE